MVTSGGFKMNILQSHDSEYIARFRLDLVNTPRLSQNTTVALRLAGSKQILKGSNKWPVYVVQTCHHQIHQFCYTLCAALLTLKPQKAWNRFQSETFWWLGLLTGKAENVVTSWLMVLVKRPPGSRITLQATAGGSDYRVASVSRTQTSLWSFSIKTFTSCNTPLFRSALNTALNKSQRWANLERWPKPWPSWNVPYS